MLMCGSLLTHKASEAGSIARSAVKGENLFSIATGAMCHTERIEVSLFFPFRFNRTLCA